MKMMKRIGLLGLTALMLVALSGIAAAGTCTFNSPAASATIKGGSALFNVTTTGNTVVNCTITGSSSASGDSSFVGGTLLNNTGGANEANVTISTLAESDASDWTFTATCNNASNAAVDTCTRSSIVIDNTVPTCVASESGSSTYAPSQTWTVTGVNATSATVQFGSNTPYSMSEASDVFTYTGNGITVPESIYTVSFRTTDGTNLTLCSLSDVLIDKDEPVKAAAILLASQETKKGAQGGLGGLGDIGWPILVLVGLGIYLLLNAKKKR